MSRIGGGSHAHLANCRWVDGRGHFHGADSWRDYRNVRVVTTTHTGGDVRNHPALMDDLHQDEVSPQMGYATIRSRC